MDEEGEFSYPQIHLPGDGLEPREHDSCGLAAVVDLQGQASRQVMDLILSALCDLDLRGARIEDTGDGAGLILRTAGLRGFLERFIPAGTHVPEAEALHAGMLFLPSGDDINLPILHDRIDGLLAHEGVKPMSWRTSLPSSAVADHLPTHSDVLGRRARERAPLIAQVLFAKGFNTHDSLPLALHKARLAIESQMPGVDVVSLQRGTVTYKAMATGSQLRRFYGDFDDPSFVTDAAGSHTRFATNVLSRWGLAQPFRALFHNGEINTIAALREAIRDLERSLHVRDTVLMRAGSDSADLDRLVELFHAHGVPLSETLRRIFQPTPVNQQFMPADVQTYHRAVRRALGTLSAAEGPAAVLAMDDKELVAAMDGLGLRPFRAIETRSGLVVFTSEIGAPSLPLEDVQRTFQLDAGELVVVSDGKISYPGVSDRAIVERTGLNFRELGNGHRIVLSPTRESRESSESPEKTTVTARWNAFGGDDRLLSLVSAMAKEGKEPVLGMGNDRALAAFSASHPRLASYFHQIVAMVTNPPMDPIREEASMDLRTTLGRRPKAHEHAHSYSPQAHVELEHPFLSSAQFQALLDTETHSEGFSVYRISTHLSDSTEEAFRKRIEQIKQEAIRVARRKRHSVLVFSDSDMQQGESYIPPALVIAAVHNALSESGLRRNVSLVSDTGEAFEAHDMALLLAMGADAVHPRLLWEAVDAGMISVAGKERSQLHENLMKTHVATLKKIMSKMGITSIEGYRGSKLMQAVGLDPLLVQYYLRCPVANIGGATLKDLVEDIQARSGETKKVRRNTDARAYSRGVQKALEAVAWGGHADPKAAYRAFVAAVRAQDPVYLSDLLELRPPTDAEAVSIDDVMPIEQLFKDHIRGAAMSHGALTLSAHRAISGAFNELGGMANSGEGGEITDRNKGGRWAADRSRIRQRSSALFGFGAEYLVNADEIEIKVGQGAKPGEGGHLPCFKVGPLIARTRNTQVGIDLISPPPLHDMYSIEDLARLIQDLRAVNPTARIAVKVTSNTDIGTVAVGVAKAGADVIAVSGWEGGTGAAVSSAIDHTGLPRELGLADIHQALVRNGLRDLVKVRVDGGIKTGEEIVKLACLGADEFALGTALLVAGERCIFCHSCSGQAKGTLPGTFGECPTGITSVTPAGGQKLGLGARKAGPDELLDSEDSYHRCKAATKHYLTLLAEEVRERLAGLGKKNITDIVGDTTLLEQVARNPRADRVKLRELLRDVRGDIVGQRAAAVAAGIDRTLTRPAINDANQWLLDAVRANESLQRELRTCDRSFGAALAGAIARGDTVLPPEGIHVETTGYAGQSYGFCNVAGVMLDHTGFANDFVAMAQSAGTTLVKQPEACYSPANSVAGNACAYGASGGNVYLAGKVGQRFGVRNCGAVLVSEGTGIYPYEYMTGGVGIDLGQTGNQGGSGMTGGRLFLRDEDGALDKRLHPDVMITPFTAADKATLLATLSDYAERTHSPLANSLLVDFEAAFSSFKRVVPKDHYINAVTAILVYDFYRLDEAEPFDELLETAARELLTHHQLDENNDALRTSVIELLKGAQTAFAADPEATAAEPPLRFQRAKAFAQTFVHTLAPTDICSPQS